MPSFAIENGALLVWDIQDPFTKASPKTMGAQPTMASNGGRGGRVVRSLGLVAGKTIEKTGLRLKSALEKCPPVGLDQGSVRGYPVHSCRYGNIKF